MAEIRISIRLFGAFRQYGEKVEISLPSGSTAGQVKAQLARALSLPESGLIADSALANDNSVIGSDEVFTADVQLAILPPVCGG